MEQFVRQVVPRDKVPEVVRFKWAGYPVLREGFTPFPKLLTRTLQHVAPAGLGATHLSVLLSVVDDRRPSLTRLPALPYLAFLAGLDEETTEQCLRDLASADLIEIRHLERDAVDVSVKPLVERVMQLVG